MQAFSTTRRVRVFLDSLITALANMERPADGPPKVEEATAPALILDHPDRSQPRLKPVSDRSTAHPPFRLAGAIPIGP
jgi:hypothetical protein